MFQTPSLFEALAEAIEKASVLTDASEIHGIVVGQLCGGQETADSRWRENLFDLVNNGEALPEQVQHLVEDVRQATLKNLLDDQLGFRLMLPDDEQGFESQVEALTQWVQGFLAGLASIKPDLSDASDDLQECIRDLSEIALLDVPEEADEESDLALTELQEYVRISAMMAFAEFGMPPMPAPEPALH